MEEEKAAEEALFGIESGLLGLIEKIRRERDRERKRVRC